MQSVARFGRYYIEKLGASVIESISDLGRVFEFSLRFFYWLVKPPYRLKLLFDQIYFIGNKSLFIICLSGAFTGMVMAYQTYFGFKLISVDTLVGPVTAKSLAMELAPVLSGLIVAGRAGAAMAAQIGTMKVTEQIDALEVMGINSVQYLAVPRIIGAFLSLPLLNALFLFVGNVGSWFVGTKFFGIDEAIYFSKLGEFVFVEDVAQGMIKSAFFGFTIAIIGTFHGFQVEGGAEGVGRGTNMAVVWGMILVLVLDYFLTSFLLQVL